MDLTELVHKIRKGDKSLVGLFKRALSAEVDATVLKRIGDSNWQEDEISIPVYERILEINPRDDGTLASLGLIKYLIGEDVDASECLEKARAVNPEGVQVLTLQAALEKRSDEQVRLYKKILELDPTNSVALHNLEILRKA